MALGANKGFIQHLAFGVRWGDLDLFPLDHVNGQMYALCR